MSKETKDKDIKLLESLGKRIRNKRKELKISQGDIANLLNVSDTQIYRYELGYSLIPLDNILKLCKLFNVDIYYFLSDIKKEKQENNSIAKYPDNPELEKKMQIIKQIYEDGDETLIDGIEICLTGYINKFLKKQQKQKGNKHTPKKTGLAGNS